MAKMKPQAEPESPEPESPEPESPEPNPSDPALDETKAEGEEVPTAPPLPSLGRIVHYRLSEQDADQIRTHLAIGHVNSLEAGAYVAAIVVGAWGGSLCNLKLQMDGELRREPWFTSRDMGSEPGTWCWPPRV